MLGMNRSIIVARSATMSDSTRRLRIRILGLARFCDTLWSELQNQRDSSKLMILVRFFGFEVPTRTRQLWQQLQIHALA
jgi:hypothetical protein